MGNMTSRYVATPRKNNLTPFPTHIMLITPLSGAFGGARHPLCICWLWRGAFGGARHPLCICWLWRGSKEGLSQKLSSEVAKLDVEMRGICLVEEKVFICTKFCDSTKTLPKKNAGGSLIDACSDLETPKCRSALHIPSRGLDGGCATRIQST